LAQRLVFEDGKRRRPHILRITLSCSAKAIASRYGSRHRELHSHFGELIQGFGGVPKTLVIDNLKAAVTNADWFDPDLIRSGRVRAALRTVILPTKPYTPDTRED